MSLKSKIAEDLTAAMKAREELKKEVLRMLKTEVMKEEVSGNEKHELEDAEILKIVKRMVKQRKDSIEQFEKGGRDELAAKEKEEIPILEYYLPAQLSEEQVVEIVAKKKEALGVSDKSKMGMLIGAVMKEVGDTAEGNVVKEIVEKSFD